MKRKTFVIVGITGVLLTGTALTGFMVNAYLGSQRIRIAENIGSDGNGRTHIEDRTIS